MHGFLYTADGLYRFKPMSVTQPYVLAGVGVLSLKPNANNGVNQGNVNAGAGLQVFFKSWGALRAEVKDIYTLSGGKNDILINAGISFLLGS